MSAPRQAPTSTRAARARSRVALLVVAWAALCTSGAACPAEKVPPASLDIRLRMRQSCGLNLASYSTECLAGVRMVVRKDGAPVETQCSALSEAKPNLLSFLLEDDPYVTINTSTTQGKVTLEIQGLTDKGADDGADLCALGDDPRTWLFFGESEEVDLETLSAADAGPLSVEIRIDCRDCENGCDTLGDDVCPINPLSFCVPGSVTLNCEKPCQDADDCFEGALQCDTQRQRCDQGTATPGEYCAPCRGDEDCETGLGYFCVGLPGETVGLCAYRCPDDRCLNGTRCNRIYNSLRLLGTQGATSADGGTPQDAGPAGDGGVVDGGVDGGVADGGDSGAP